MRGSGVFAIWPGWSRGAVEIERGGRGGVVAAAWRDEPVAGTTQPVDQRGLEAVDEVDPAVAVPCAQVTAVQPNVS